MAQTNAFKEKTVKWYTLGPVLSRNGVINIILGPRGDGKTYAAKSQALRNFFKRGEEFIYLRRYTTELSSRRSFFSDIAWEYPDHDFRVEGDAAQTREKGTKAWRTMGYFVSLSKAQQKKSVPYPLVTLIIFDEFIIDRGALHYLPGETRAFLDFFSTVDRYQDKTRALLISNTVSIANPYFISWGIKPKDETEWWTSDDGFVVAHFIKDDQFTREVRKTRLGQFIDSTDYGSYAIDAKFADNHDNLIAKKTPEATYMYTLETESGTFAVWYDWGRQEYYVTNKRPRKEVNMTMLKETHATGKVYVQYGNKLLADLRWRFNHGRVFFDEPNARSAFMGVLIR